MKKVLITSILFLYCITLYAQSDTTKQVELNDIHRVEIDLAGRNPLKVERREHVSINSIVLNAGYGWSSISNDWPDELKENFYKNSGSAWQFSVHFRKQFMKEAAINDRVFDVPTAVAFGAGIGLSHYKKSIGFKSFEEQLDETDKDGDNYKAHLIYSDVTEELGLTYLDIPLYLEFGKPSMTKFQPYARIGLKGSLLISNNPSRAGSFSSTGHYNRVDGKTVDVILFDISDLEFANNRDFAYDKKTAPELNLNSFVLWSTVAAGVNIPLSSPDKDVLRNIILRLGVKWDYSLMPVSSNIENESVFKKSQYWLKQSNILREGGNHLQFFGLEMGLIVGF